MTGTKLQYLDRQNIDILKWDRCIETAMNSMPYAFSYYLDNMAPDWQAIVAGDYKTVMPLTWRKKFGITYLYQPAFTQQLGVFSDAVVDYGMLETMLAETKKHFGFAEIFLNYRCDFPGTSSQHNFILNLGRSYPDIRAGYKTDLVNNLRQSGKTALRYTECELVSALENFRTAYATRFPHVTNNDYKAFKSLCEFARENQKLVLRAVYDEAGAILSSALFISDCRRLILLQSFTSSEGRHRHANHYLLDRVIHEFAGSQLTLDFEGSEVPGIAHFYRNFGAADQPYFFYRYNELPWPIRLFKK